jgi:hypothetical protein
MLDTMGLTCAKVRSDMVIFETAGGGKVFSVGSINWIWTMGQWRGTIMRTTWLE